MNPRTQKPKVRKPLTGRSPNLEPQPAKPVQETDRFERGDYKPGDQPSQFAGIWKDTPHPTAAEVREQAWRTPRRK